MNFIYAVALAAVAVYNGFGLLFVLALRKQEMILKRQLTVVVVKTVLLFLITAYYIVNLIRYYYFGESADSEIIPCLGDMIMNYIISVAWMFSFLLRAGHLFAIYKFQHLKLNANTKGEPRQSISQSQTNPSEKQATKSMGAMNGFSMRVLNRLFIMLSLSSYYFYKILGHNVTRGTRQTVTRSDIPIMLLWMTLFNVVIIILIVLVDWKLFQLDPWQAGCYKWDMFIMYFYVLVFISLVPPFLISLHNIKDSLYIRVELTVSICVFSTAFFVYLSNLFLSKPFISGSVPLTVAACLINILTTYFPCFIQTYRMTRPLEPNCTAEYLDSIIANSTLRRRFLRMAAKQLVIENVYFLIDYGAKLKEGEDTQGATALFEKYIDSQASYELNLPYSLKIKIVSAKKKGNLTLEHFDKVSQHVKGLLVANTLQPFINLERKGG